MVVGAAEPRDVIMKRNVPKTKQGKKQGKRADGDSRNGDVDEETTRKKAYELYEFRTRVGEEGSPEEDWRAAEQLLAYQGGGRKRSSQR